MIGVEPLSGVDRCRGPKEKPKDEALEAEAEQLHATIAALEEDKAVLIQEQALGAGSYLTGS